jgi:hypothetical protein
VTNSASARGSGSPEFIELDAPGVKSTRAWVGRDPRYTRDLPRAKARHGRGSSDEHDGGGGSARRRNDGARVPASGAVYGLRHLAQKEQGTMVLIEGSGRAGGPCRGAGDDGGRRRTDGDGRHPWGRRLRALSELWVSSDRHGESL